MRTATAVVFASLIVILAVIFWKGFPSLSWEMISQTPKGGFYFGKEGGILNAIVGSFLLGIGATVLALVFSIPIVVALNVYATPHSKWVHTIRLFLDILWGIPSIVFGAFGFIVMTTFGMKVSLLAGMITLAVLILPVITRALDELVQTVPNELMEASFSLGATKQEYVVKVLLRKIFPGLVMATLLGFGRAIGDAASVMFTTGFTDNLPTGITKPAATLPLAIFFQLSSPIPEVRERAYAAAVILTIIILVVSYTARLLNKRFAQQN